MTVNKIVELSREQYELLLTVGDLALVRSSVKDKRDAAAEAGASTKLLDRFLDRIDLRMMRLAEEAARLGLHDEFARATNGFPNLPTVAPQSDAARATRA